MRIGKNMAKQISRERIMRGVCKMCDGEANLIRYGILLERKRVELGSAEKLVQWMKDNNLPHYGTEKYFA